MCCSPGSQTNRVSHVWAVLILSEGGGPDTQARVPASAFFQDWAVCTHPQGTGFKQEDRGALLPAVLPSPVG